MSNSDILILIISIISSVIITIFITLFFSSRRKISFCINTKTLFNKNLDIFEFKLSYEGREIVQLKETHLTVKNHGNRTIDGNDISKNDPLTIKLLGGEFLLCKVQKNSKANNFTVNRIDKRKYSFNFDYLDKKDEVTLIFFHDSRFEPTLTGKIKSCRLINRNSKGELFTSIFNIIITSFLIIFFPLLIIFVDLPMKMPFILFVAIPVVLFGILGLFYNARDLYRSIKLNSTLNIKK